MSEKSARWEMNRRKFLKRLGASAAGMAFASLLVLSAAGAEPRRPNILLIMADDLGYSDLGCYGSEIHTPNLDRLAANGLRFTQFYNAGKCAPTRASLLTGLYPHQTGADGGGDVMQNSVTIAEALREAGYFTAMTGKWHAKETPRQRGFDRFYGILSGACSYFTGQRWDRDSDILRLNDQSVRAPKEGYYTTDAFTDYANQFIEQGADADKPFFCYVAYTAPHYPLHAWPEDIARYRGTYLQGWDVTRTARFRRMREMGILDKDWILSEPEMPPKSVWRDRVPPWDEAEDQGEEALKMAVYAAMVDRMDQNIGRMVRKLEMLGELDNTLILFLSDNGGCPFDKHKTPDIPPGPAESYRSYDTPWANVSNTPFRQYKRHSHEGGISTPLIAHWPAAIAEGGGLNRETGHLIDIMATCLDVAGAEYPDTYQGRDVLPLEGKSLLPIFHGRDREPHETLFWEYSGHRAVRRGDWKLVALDGEPWALYDMDGDRSETNDLATDRPQVAAELAQLWDEWYARVRREGGLD